MSNREESPPHPRDDNWLPKCFFENQERFPPEELMGYAGKYIAWSWEGDRILASGDSYEELDAKLTAAGVNPSRTVYAYVDPPGSIVAGGWQAVDPGAADGAGDSRPGA